MRREILRYIGQNQILVALFVLATAWLAIEIRGVLLALFVSYILMASISPYVEFLQKRHVPKPLAVIVPYLAAIFFLILLIMSLLPFFIAQIQLLFLKFPSYLNAEIKLFGFPIDPSSINVLAESELQNIEKNVFFLTGKLFGGIVSTISILAISFYLLLYRDTVRKSFVSMFPQKNQGKVEKTTLQIEDKLGGWLRGQLLLSGSIGTITWILLTLLGVDFALPLAVMAGMLEIVPTIGPIIAAIPAVIVALNISLPMGFFVAGAYFIIQFLENNLLVPKIMEKAVGLNPIVIILGIIIGGRLLGISGALLAIPFISLLFVIYRNLE